MSRELIEKQNVEAALALKRINATLDAARQTVLGYAEQLKAGAKPNDEILSELMKEYLGVDLVPDWADALVKEALEVDIPWGDIERWLLRAVKLVAIIKALR